VNFLLGTSLIPASEEPCCQLSSDYTSLLGEILEEIPNSQSTEKTVRVLNLAPKHCT